MGEDVKISVIVATYNPGKWFGACVASVLNQSEDRIELIVVDDGSECDIREHLAQEQIADPRLRIERIGHSGVSGARNHGLSVARGEWIAFADDDDMLHPDNLHRLLGMAESTGAEIAVGRMRYSELPDFRAIGRSRVALLTGRRAALHALHQTAGFDNGVCAKLFRRDMFDPDVSFRPGRYEDLDIIYRLYERASKVVVTPEQVYFYRKRPGSFINTFSAARADVLDVADRIVRHYSGADRVMKAAAADRAFGAACNILMALSASGASMSETERRCVDMIRRHRLSVAINPRVRLKNKVGALAALLSPRIFKFASRFVSAT